MAEQLETIAEGIVKETFQNPHYADYHVKEELPGWMISAIKQTKGVVRKGFIGEGVNYDPDRFMISVTKGKAFSWDEIDPEIVKILTDDPRLPFDEAWDDAHSGDVVAA